MGRKMIAVSDELHARLVAAAQAANCKVGTGPGSQLGEFIGMMLDVYEQQADPAALALAAQLRRMQPPAAPRARRGRREA